GPRGPAPEQAPQQGRGRRPGDLPVPVLTGRAARRRRPPLHRQHLQRRAGLAAAVEQPEPGGEAAVPLVAVDRRLVPGADDARATGARVVDGLDGPLQPLGAPLLGLGPRALSLLVLLLDLLLAGAGPVPLRPGRGAGRLPGR